jgi:biotin operon repressor
VVLQGGLIVLAYLHLGQMTHGINPAKLNLPKVMTLYSEELDRMGKKTPEQMLRVELENEFGFSPIVARALLNKIDSYNSSNKTSNLSVGTIFYWAASSREPAGKAIEEMDLKQVRLTLNTSTDISILRENGMQALREAKITRITEETQDQDAYLTQEDIAVLLCSSVRTIRRDIERLRKQGIDIPTRGQKMDIGKGVSHKTIIVELYLKNYQYTDIQRQTRHSTESIERYIQDFTRVVMLLNTGLNIADIRQATSMSEKLINEYIELYRKYDSENNTRLKEIKSNAVVVKKGGIRV